ncbi:MAG TPA: histidine kinase, partial [Chitinophagaceae bacterium]
MKVRWKQHELILATLFTVLAIAGYWWKWVRLSPEEIQSVQAAPFSQHGVPFSYLKNIFLPRASIILAPYLCYLAINLLFIPALPARSGSKKKTGGPVSGNWKKILLMTVNFILMIALLGVVFDIAAYYESQYYFSYPGFTFFPPFGYHPLPQLDITGGFKLAIFLTFTYISYACVRELMTWYIDRSGDKNAYKILLLNRVTAFLVFYFSVLYLLFSFTVPAYLHVISAVSLVLAVFAVVMSNVYWLFPLTEKYPFFSAPFITRLLVSTAVITFLFVFVIRPLALLVMPAFLSCWAVQLFVVTPLSWLAYRQQKDTIQQLRGMEKALKTSTASLQLLRSQINPHFLFNALNTLYGTALQENAGRTAEGIQKLGDMMRFMLHDNNLDQIQMTREISYLENYISLQQLRTQSSPDISIESNISTAQCDYMVAPMLFIPFVENAFKHGISLKEKSWINIRLSCHDRQIHFEVSNSVHSRQPNDPGNESSGIGLINVRERLQLLYPGRHQLIARENNREFLVRLS